MPRTTSMKGMSYICVHIYNRLVLHVLGFYPFTDYSTNEERQSEGSPAHLDPNPSLTFCHACSQVCTEGISKQDRARH